MNLIALINILDKDLFLTILYSLAHFIYYKIIIFLILHIKDDYLFFITPIIRKNNILNLVSDSSSESESTSESESNTDSDNEHKNIFNKKQYNFIRLHWEYDIILKLFNIPNIKYTIINNSDDEKLKKNEIYLKNEFMPINNQNIMDDDLLIINSFLFNINIFKKFNYGDVTHKTPKYDYDITLKDTCDFHKKIILLYYLNNNINSNVLKELFPNYRYFYIIYKNYKNNYMYKLIDLHNNYDIIKNKNILFNRILL